MSHPSVLTPATETIPNNEPVQSDEHTLHSSSQIDSMLTIRPSDSTNMPLEDCAIEDYPVEALPSDGTDEAAVDRHRVSSSTREPQEIHTNGDLDVHILEAEVKLFQRSHRMSTSSMPSVAEEAGPVQRPASSRSRSDSSGALSSSSSTHVDWEELARAEEAAPRDEGSDEVIAPISQYSPSQD